MSTRINDELMQDFTVAINKIPRGWNLLDEMGLSTTVGISTETASVDVVQERTDTFGDTRRGGERNKVGNESVITKPLAVPFFTLDGVLRPTDIQNLRRWGTENDLQSTDEAVEKIMTRIRRYQGALREKALAEAVQGRAYVPNGTTEAYNYYTVFNQTQTSIDFELGTAGTNVLEKAEQAWGAIIDNAQDGANSYEVICLASPDWFSKFIKHPSVENAYLYYQSTQEPLRNRQGGGSIYREFVHGNVKYIEYRGAFNGTALIPAGEAYFLPMGIEDMFTTYHAPADHLDYVNTEGQETYMFVNRSQNGRKIEVESETAMLVANQRPELVIKATTSN